MVNLIEKSSANGMLPMKETLVVIWNREDGSIGRKEVPRPVAEELIRRAGRILRAGPKAQSWGCRLSVHLGPLVFFVEAYD